MASAIGVKIESQGFVGDNPPQLRIQYEVFFFDQSLEIASPSSVLVDVPLDATPQQFRSIFTQAIIAKAAELWPTMTLNAGDCLIDVVQRGN